MLRDGAVTHHYQYNLRRASGLQCKGGTMIKIEPYMEERLLKFNRMVEQVDGNDITLVIGMLLIEHDTLEKIKSLCRR